MTGLSDSWIVYFSNPTPRESHARFFSPIVYQAQSRTSVCGTAVWHCLESVCRRIRVLKPGGCPVLTIQRACYFVYSAFVGVLSEVGDAGGYCVRVGEVGGRYARKRLIRSRRLPVASRGALTRKRRRVKLVRRSPPSFEISAEGVRNCPLPALYQLSPGSLLRVYRGSIKLYRRSTSPPRRRTAVFGRPH